MFRWKWCRHASCVDSKPKKNMCLIIWGCSPPREATLQLGSVPASLEDSPQQSADCNWGETCLLLLNVCPCLFISMFYQLCCPSSGGQIGALCAESFVSVFFLRQMMCVTMEIRFSIRKRSTCWLCYVWIKNSYNTCVKSTSSWVVKHFTEQ